MMLKNLTQFGPQLELVKVKSSTMNKFTCYFNLSSLKPLTVPLGMYLRSDYLSVYRSP